MPEQPDNIVLLYLRRFDEKLDRVSEDVRELKVRMTSLEEAVVGINRRIDRIEVRFDRIERRLDLADQPH